MNIHVNSSPVSLSYVAALRGVKPRQPGENFTYAEINCVDPTLLTCLAASNPEGQFFGHISDNSLCNKAIAAALDRGVKNVTFVSGKISELAGKNVLPLLNYIVCDESRVALAPLERNALFTIAEKGLKPGGLFNTTYKAFEGSEALRFLVRELAPEMNPGQARVFLDEIKKIGSRYLSKNPSVAKKLDEAIAKNAPNEFFAGYDVGEARSVTFNTIVALRPRGFAYAGDSAITANYIELSLPVEAQSIISDCKSNPLYESIKDFALDRNVRSDIWCRLPALTTNDFAELYGSFTYGITVPQSEIPTSFQAVGATIDLSTPLYQKLIELMSLLPIKVGDFLAHPNGNGFAANDVVGAIQILVACGLAQPMRGLNAISDVSTVSQPRLVGSFNKYLDKTLVMGSELWMASPVAGNAVSISARDALVIQALGRGGLANSVSALLPELERIIKVAGSGSDVMQGVDLSPESARDMIQDVVSKSIVQWYAYGLLEAA